MSSWDQSRFSLLACVLLIVMAVPFHVSLLWADVVGTWDGDTPTLNWLNLLTEQEDEEGNVSVSVSYHGLGVTWFVGGLTLDADLSDSRAPASERPILWNEPLNWGNAVLWYSYVQNMKKVLLGGDEISFDPSGDMALAEYEGLNGIINSGPTEKDVTITVATVQLPIIPDLSFDIGAHVKFNVDIDGGRYVLLNQDSTLERLYIDASSTLEIEENRSLFLRQPSSNDGTVVNAGQLTGMSGFTSSGRFVMESGRLSGDFLNAGNFDWSGGAINGTVTNVSDTFKLTGTGAITNGSALNNSGLITHAPGGVLAMQPNATLNNLAGGTYDLQTDGWVVKPQGDAGNYYGVANINNAGTFRKSEGSGEAIIGSLPGYSGIVAFHNSGTVQALSGTLTFSGGFTQTAGVTRVDGGTIRSTTPLNILGGSVEGTGTILASILNEGGTVSPGFSPGALTINGNYVQGPDATLLLEIAGLLPGQFDVFNVTGTATLDGYLQISFLDGFRPELGDTFPMFTYGSRIGEFDSIFFTGLSGFEFTPIYGLDGLTIRTDSVQAVPLSGSVWLGAAGILVSLFCMYRCDHGAVMS